MTNPILTAALVFLIFVGTHILFSTSSKSSGGFLTALFIGGGLAAAYLVNTYCKIESDWSYVVIGMFAAIGYGAADLIRTRSRANA